jgi:hypothetical protein
MTFSVSLKNQTNYRKEEMSGSKTTNSEAKLGSFYQSANTNEGSVQEALKALRNFSSDEVIQSIEEIFKQFNDIPRTLEDYEAIVNLQGGFINLINGLTVEGLNHLDEHQSPNTKEVDDPSNHDLKNEKTGEQLIVLLDHLKRLANNVAYSKRIGFMRDILNAPNKKEILFSNVFTEERINKRYRKLASYFHPDKTKGFDIPRELREEYITLGTELFKCSLEFKKSLFELEESSNNDDFTKTSPQTLHEEKANELWKIAIDYHNAHKAQWDKLKLLKEENLREMPSEELKRNSIYYGLKAYEEYRAACKLADNNKLLKSQIKLRGYMALSLYICDQFMEVQLYALTAINFVIRNLTNATHQDLYEAKQIFDKVKSGNPCGSENTQLNTEIKPENIYRSINDDLEKISTELMLKANRRKVRYLAIGGEILQTKRNGRLYQIIQGTQLLEEAKTREALNEIMKQALLAYDKGDHQKFFEELSNEYKSGRRLLTLESPGDSIQHKVIVNTLIEHGFRSGGIAYLLILISEVLIRGKIKIQGITTEELKTQGYHVLYGVLSKRLEDEANKLDDRIQTLRKKSWKSPTSIFQIYKNFFMDLINIREYSTIAQEYAKEILFVSTLEEMRNIARINLAIRDILNNGPEEIKRAKQLIEEVRESINSHHQYIGSADTHLEALEELFWVVSGESASFEVDLAIDYSNLDV